MKERRERREVKVFVDLNWPRIPKKHILTVRCKDFQVVGEPKSIFSKPSYREIDMVQNISLA